MKRLSLVFSLLAITSLLLSACSPDPNFVICPSNPADHANPACRPDDPNNKANPANEVRVPAVKLNGGLGGIYYGYKADFEPIILNGTGALPYPDSQVALIPIEEQKLFTDSNPEGEYCKKYGLLCLGHIKGTIQYGEGEAVKVIESEISIVMYFKTILTPDTDNLWLSFEKANHATYGKFLESLWDQFRVPKNVNISASKVDPIADRGGDKTLSAIQKTLLDRLNKWDKRTLFEIKSLEIKSVTLPGTVNVQTGAGGNIPAPALQNADVVATEGAVKVQQAKIFASEIEAICGKNWQTMGETCVNMIRTYKGLPPSTTILLPTILATPVAPITSTTK